MSSNYVLGPASIMDTTTTVTLSLPQGAEGFMFTTQGDNVKSLLYNVNVGVATMRHFHLLGIMN